MIVSHSWKKRSILFYSPVHLKALILCISSSIYFPGTGCFQWIVDWEGGSGFYKGENKGNAFFYCCCTGWFDQILLQAIIQLLGMIVCASNWTDNSIPSKPILCRDYQISVNVAWVIGIKLRIKHFSPLLFMGYAVNYLHFCRVVVCIRLLLSSVCSVELLFVSAVLHPECLGNSLLVGRGFMIILLSNCFFFGVTFRLLWMNSGFIGVLEATDSAVPQPTVQWGRCQPCLACTTATSPAAAVTRWLSHCFSSIPPYIAVTFVFLLFTILTS